MYYEVLRRESWFWLPAALWMLLPAAALAEPPLQRASAIASDDAPPSVPLEPAAEAAPSADVLISDLPQVQRAIAVDPPGADDPAAPARLPAVDGPAKPAPLTAKAEPAERRTTAPIDAASMQGVHPGKTTRDELHTNWGKPNKIEKVAGGFRETFDVKPFEHVRATIKDDVVDALTIRLQNPIAVEILIDNFQIGDVEPVDVYDAHGQLLGQSYPERGVLFGFEAGSDPPQVFQMVLEPINAQPFLARAETRLATRYDDCVADLKQALELAPESGRTHWLHAELSLRVGELREGIESARKAVALEPRETEYRLTLARLLAEKGDHAAAIDQIVKIIDGANTLPIIAAQAHCQWGDCLATGAEHDYYQAYKHHQQAIKLAEPLAASDEIVLRRAAKTVLVDATLGAAYDIGWGRWQNKAQAMAKWLDKALAHTDDVVEHDRGIVDVRLRLYEGALSAIAGLSEPPDASEWIQGLTDFAANTADQATDPGYQSHLAWRLGAALGDAVEIEAAQAHPERALELGQRALAYFEVGASVGKQMPAHDMLRGRLCYRLGTIFASEHSDHKQALAWFDQAVPLLQSKQAASAAINPARQGESYVSMAVSYWEVSNREEALRLTQQGVTLMEQAVGTGKLDKSALTIAYRNLASMHQQLGHASQARRFVELATRAEKNGSGDAPTRSAARPAIKR